MTQAEKIKSISKTLSPNDIGLTGGHQAGILVPKNGAILSFFPKLDIKEKNPRYIISFYDENNEKWEFSFIYYNNFLFGGTRNEYRLTRMTKYIKRNNLKVGDQVILTNTDSGTREISHKRHLKQEATKLKLSGEWKTVKF